MSNETIKTRVGEHFKIEVYAAARYRAWWMTEFSGGAALKSVERTDGSTIDFSFCAYKPGKYFAKFNNFDITKNEPGEEKVYEIIIEN